MIKFVIEIVMAFVIQTLDQINFTVASTLTSDCLLTVHIYPPRGVVVRGYGVLVCGCGVVLCGAGSVQLYASICYIHIPAFSLNVDSFFLGL